MSVARCHPENPCAAGLDPLYIKTRDSGGLDLEAGGLDAGCWQDWRDWKWAAARWEKGLEGRPTRLTLQEVGGSTQCMPAFTIPL